MFIKCLKKVSAVFWVILPAPYKFLLHSTIEVKRWKFPLVKTQIHPSLHIPFTHTSFPPTMLQHHWCHWCLLPFAAAPRVCPLPFVILLAFIFYPIPPPRHEYLVCVCFFIALSVWSYKLTIHKVHTDCQSVWTIRIANPYVSYGLQICMFLTDYQSLWHRSQLQM